MAGCSPTDLSCLLAAGRAGTNIYDAQSSAPSLPGTIPGQSSGAHDYVGSALQSIGLGGVDKLFNEYIDTPLGSPHAPSAAIEAVGNAASFLSDPPRIAVTLIGFLLIAGGVFMLGRNQIMQVVKP